MTIGSQYSRLHLPGQFWQGPVMLSKYLTKVVQFAGRGFVLRLDGWQIAFSSMVPFVYRWMGWPMPSDTTDFWLAVAFIIMACLVFLRFITAPYFIWKEDQRRISELEGELEKPAQAIKLRMSEKLAEDRYKLAGEVSRILREVCEITNNEEAKKVLFANTEVLTDKFWNDPTFVRLWREFTKAVNRADEQLTMAVDIEGGITTPNISITGLGQFMKMQERENVGQHANRMIHYLIYNEEIAVPVVHEPQSHQETATGMPPKTPHD